MSNYYFSLQYSAIQKVILRHNRLWSIAGISQGLARLNEIEFIEIVQDKYDGKVLVAGGGKFTARFSTLEAAKKAKSATIQQLSTNFPMLEFQVSKVVTTNNFEAAKANGILENLAEQKQQFRGYATSYLPHLAVCSECGEYPAETNFPTKDHTYICRTCQEAWQNARIDFTALKGKGSKGLTTLERIYAEYLKSIPGPDQFKLVYNFADIFPINKDEIAETKQRMAVWFSDLNNMNGKVRAWLAQDEEQILATFDKVKDINITIIAATLTATFKRPAYTLPFRLIVAGGDDLCLVMAEEYILSFAKNLDTAVRNKILELNKDSDSPLNEEWLKKNIPPDKDGNQQEAGPYSFGGSFIITSVHTPFCHIHAVGERLMGTAKETTNRLGNSVNWRIMAEDEAVAENLLDFERPLFISREDNLATMDKTSRERLSLADYLDLRDKFSSAPNRISSSHRYAIIAKLIDLRQQNRENDFENWLKRYDSGDSPKSFSGLLTDNRLRLDNKEDGPLAPARITTLFELLGIKKSPSSLP